MELATTINMSTYIVRIKGYLYRHWKVNQEIPIADCRFTDFNFPDCTPEQRRICLFFRENNREFIANVEVEADSFEEAEKLGIIKFSNAASFFRITTGESMVLNHMPICIKEKKSGKTVRHLPSQITLEIKDEKSGDLKYITGEKLNIDVIRNEELDDEQLNNIRKLQVIISSENNSGEGKEALELSAQDRYVFIGEKYGTHPYFIPIVKSIIIKHGFVPVVASEYEMPRTIHDKSLTLLHYCKYAIFQVGTPGGQYLEIEHTPDYNIKPLLLAEHSEELMISQMISTFKPNIKLYKNIQELIDIIERYLSEAS